MGDAAEFFAQKVREREIAKSAVEAQQASQEAQMRQRLADKLKGVTVIKRKPLWFLPAFFSKRVTMAGKIADLEKSLFDYADFCARQSSALKRLYKWALEHESEDGTLEPFKTEFGPLDPAKIWEGGLHHQDVRRK